MKPLIPPVLLFFGCAVMLLAAPVQETEDEQLSTVTIGANAYSVQKFTSPDGNLSINTYVDLEHDDAFVRLLRLSDKHLVSSISFRHQKVRTFDVVWNEE